MTKTSADEQNDAVLITGLGHSGEGVGRYTDGRVLFVAGAVPGDEVIPTHVTTKKGIVFAEGYDLLTPSPDRVETPCTSTACGGCPLQALKAQSQRVHKGDRLVQTLKRIGGIDAKEMFGGIESVSDGEGWQYRYRTRLHATFVGGLWEFGFHARKSNDVVPFTSCPALAPALEGSVQGVIQALSGLPRAAGIKEIEVSYSKSDARAAARVTCDGPLKYFRKLPEEILDWGISGLMVVSSGTQGSKPRQISLGSLSLRYDHKAAGDVDLWFQPGVFTQVNPAANDLLVTTVKQMCKAAEGPRVLEFHAGIGNLTLPMALAGARVTMVESNKEATVLAERNLYGAGLEGSTTLLHSTDDKTIQKLLRKGPLHDAFDVVVLDPPRSGAKAVVEALANFHGRIVYVSCDGATFARDAKSLVHNGFTLEALRGFDMFPHTPHVESVALFTKRTPTA